MKIKKLERNIKTGAYTIVFQDDVSQQTLRCTELARKEMGDALTNLIGVAVDIVGLSGGAMQSIIVTGAIWKYDKFGVLNSVELLGKYYMQRQYLKISFPAMKPYIEKKENCYGETQWKLIQILENETKRYLNGDRAQLNLNEV